MRACGICGFAGNTAGAGRFALRRARLMFRNLLFAVFVERIGMIEVTNKTGEGIAQMYADDYGNGVVGAWNRKGKGRTLKPGP